MLTGRYPGVGTVAREANPSDGLLDVAWIGSTGARAVFAKLATTVLHLPTGLTRERAREVRAECPGFRISVHVDGTPAGQLPATVTVLPRALPVIVEPIASRLREKQKAMVAELQGAALAGHFKRVARR
jgi:diacylglycerol kinase family enzyme